MDTEANSPHRNLNAEQETGKGKNPIAQMSQVLELEKPATVNEYELCYFTTSRIANYQTVASQTSLIPG